MELFKSKEGFKEKVDSNNNWKSQGQEWYDFRVTYFKTNVRIRKKNVAFGEKASKILPKRFMFIFLYFLFKWKRVKPTNMSN